MNIWITIACIAFAISFGIMLYYNRVFWYKILTVTLIFVVANMVYFSLDSVKGWPSSQKIVKGELVYVDIVEPTDTYDGAIYVYVREDKSESHWYDQYVDYVYWDTNAPRSYYIPYTKRTSKEMREAKEAMEQGYIVQISGESAEAESGSEQQSEVDNGNGTEPYQQEGANIEKYEVPHLKLIDPRSINRKAKQ